MTVPYQVSGPGPEGLEDVTIFDMVILPQSWGRLGVGVVGSFAAATSDVSAHATAGPAIGFVAGVSKKLNLGLFNQNLFGNDVAISQIQPILAYQLGSGWSLSLGDLQWPYDWDRGEFLSMPDRRPARQGAPRREAADALRREPAVRPQGPAGRQPLQGALHGHAAASGEAREVSRRPRPAGIRR